MKIDDQEFGRTIDERGISNISESEHEAEVFACFALYIMFRTRGNKKTPNPGNYAEQVWSTIRLLYAGLNGRRPVGVQTDQGRNTVRNTLNGLNEIFPTPTKPLIPILQQHLCAIRCVLNFDPSLDRTLWSVWIFQLHGEMRSGDLIKSKRQNHAIWDPSFDTHRGRVKWKYFLRREEDG